MNAHLVQRLWQLEERVWGAPQGVSVVEGV